MTSIITIIGPEGREEVTIRPMDVILVVTHDASVGGEDNTVWYQAAATRDVEIENDGDMDRVSDMCGRTETSRDTDKNWEVAIDAVVTGQQEVIGRRGDELIRNLDVESLKSIKNADQIEMLSPLHSGIMELKNIVIKQTNTLVSIDTGSGEQAAFQAQIQLADAGPQ